MLEGGAYVSSPQIGTKGVDGFVSTSPQNGVLEVTFTDKPTELTQVLVKAPADSLPGDRVTVTVVFTDVDGNERRRVRMSTPHVG